MRRWTRRAFLSALAAVTVLPLLAPRPAETVTWTEVDPLTVAPVYGPEGLESVAVESDWDDIAKLRMRDLMDRVRQRREYAKLLGAAITEKATIEQGLVKLGHVEILVGRGERVVEYAGDEDGAYTSVHDLDPSQYARLVSYVNVPAGGGFYLAERGSWRWIVARTGDAGDGYCRIPDWALTAQANNLGVGWRPTSIKARTMASDMERWKIGQTYRLPSTIESLGDGRWLMRPLPIDHPQADGIGYR